jgi:hypothetical protein
VQSNVRRWLSSKSSDRERILDSPEKVGSTVNKIIERNKGLLFKPGRAFGIFSGPSNELKELFLKCSGRSIANDGEEIPFVFRKQTKYLDVSNDLQELFEKLGGRYVVEEGREIFVKQPPPIIGWSQHSSYFEERQANNAVEPSVITGDQLRNVLDVKLETLYQSEWQYNTRLVEDELQRRFIYLEFGKRLFTMPPVAVWRGPPDRIKHKVGIMYSDKIPEFVQKGDIVVRGR